MRSKKTVYVVAALAAMILYLPLRDHGWALYLGVCAGYSILVFGLRRFQLTRAGAATVRLPASRVLLVHATFLSIVVGWVWLLVAIRQKVPYFLRWDDTDRPYFGLVFLGILALLLLEYLEQRQLRGETESGTAEPTIHPRKSTSGR